MDAVKVSNYGVGDDLFETLLKVMATSTRRLLDQGRVVGCIAQGPTIGGGCDRGAAARAGCPRAVPTGGV